MNQMNQIILEGTCVRDAEIKETPNGGKFSTVCVATERNCRNAQGEITTEVSYFDVEAWGDHWVELCSKNLKKGKQIRVVGRLKQTRWETPDGKCFSRVYIIAEYIDFKRTE